MLRRASVRYEALPDTGEARDGAGILLSNLNTSHSSTDDWKKPLSHGNNEPTDPDIQPEWSTATDFEVAGWRFGAIVAAASTSLVFLINLSVVIWVGVQLSKVTNTAHSTILTLRRGDCHDVERINVWVHLAINAVSAVLLSASNYCMQCLSAPTRKEINKTHASGKWLDIGVPSIRNLKAIGKKKLFFWWCLALSSIPLHLLFNSAFFSSISTNDYYIVYAAENFTQGAGFNTTHLGYQPERVHDNRTLDHIIGRIQSDAGSWEKLTPTECISAYATDFVSDRRTVVMVSNATHVDIGEPCNKGLCLRGSVLDFDSYSFNTVVGGYGYDPYAWLCSDPNISEKINIPDKYVHFHCDETKAGCCYNFISKVVADAAQWAPQGHPVHYCLSEKTGGQCGYNVNIVILIIVVICNLGKVVSMLYVAFYVRDDPLITVGDAIQSFLARPDKTTTGMCLVSKDDVVAMSVTVISDPEPKHYVARRLQWRTAASARRWTLFIILFLAAILIILGLLAFAIDSLPASAKGGLWALGFGAVHPSTLISGWALSKIHKADSAIVAATLIANTPQLVLSFLYMTLNGLVTSMFLAQEWSGYAVRRKGLRVSKPSSRQRRTYFLQLPYRVAVPLIVLSSVVHWLVSQSIFLAVVSTYNPDGNLANAIAVVTCGFSPMAMIFCAVAGVVLVVIVVGMGFFKFDSAIPVAGSCSMAIAAACHTDCGERAAQDLLQWGELDSGSSETEVGHCAFTNGVVRRPTVGRLYAGEVGHEF